jgi:hypothetical protein
MRGYVTALLVLFPTWAKADIIRCTFTEPFVTTVYSTTQSTLALRYETEGREDIIKNVSFQIMSAGHFELWGPDRQPLQRLRLSHNGSDGMSDRQYPYSVEWISRGLRGGCTSLHLTVK